MNPPVIDLSHWNPTPDWSALIVGGTRGIIHKATEGSSYVDPTLFERARDAMDAGLLWATYHFMRPAGDITEQVYHYLETVNPIPFERVVLDHEDSGVSLYELKEAVAFIRQRRPDLKVCIYSGHLIREQLGNTRDDYLRANTSLWIAHYTGDPEPAWPRNTWDTWDLWQYTDCARVEGVSDPIDANRWNGDPDDLADWFGKEDAGPSPGPEPTPETVRIDINVGPVPDGVFVEIYVNGNLVETY